MGYRPIYDKVKAQQQAGWRTARTKQINQIRKFWQYDSTFPATKAPHE